ncbi:MAG: V-type ATP synthase subunit D [Candidatus Omnitrophica bacterium]|nr:V-type ATP synthase subunit D [Candidatus Omnitrophota bacterium]MDD5429462.1 V-type ATP synthase subunit D [Candidatus Omnitrophota bacterium]
MAKIRLTKNELKHQKEELKRFNRYLPMLQLKEKQLKLEIVKVHQAIKELAQDIENFRNKVVGWVDVFAEDVKLSDFCSLKKINTISGNVAGIDMPVFKGVEFKESQYDLFNMPLWVDAGIGALKEMITLKAKLEVYHKQLEILKEELHIASQRVNLFEKVKIPLAQENIRVIQIYLGELQTAEVVRGKIAKAKINRRKQMAVPV